MPLVNAFSSLSIAAPAKAAGLGFKKAVAAFVPAPAARVSASRAVFTVEAKQNKKARTIQVRATSPSAPGNGRRRPLGVAYRHRVSDESLECVS